MESEYEDFLELQRARRSVNYFDSEKEVDDKLLKKIIDRAVLAPSSFNLQPWRILAVKSQEKREEIYNRGVCEQEKVIQAPVLLIILGDSRGFMRDNPMWDEKKSLDKLDEEQVQNIVELCEENIYPGREEEVGFAVRNSSLLAMSIMYTAKYFGVDTHPMIGFSADGIKNMFNLSNEMIVTMLISLGYFDANEELSPRETRLKYEDIVTEY